MRSLLSYGNLIVAKTVLGVIKRAEDMGKNRQDNNKIINSYEN